MLAGLMYFSPTDKAKAVLRDWHQVCVEGGSNNQPAWNKVFNMERRNSMDYHVMTKELYPHGYLLETRGFFANDKAVSLRNFFPYHSSRHPTPGWDGLMKYGQSYFGARPPQHVPNDSPMVEHTPKMLSQTYSANG